MSRHYIKGEEEECVQRTCFDTKTWVQKFGKSKTNENSGTPSNSETCDPGHSHSCPLDKDELGRRTWSFLHTMAAYYPNQPSSEQQTDMKDMMYLFGKFYPCDFCAKDFRKSIKKDSPDTKSQQAFSQWMCRMHNEVNEKLGKPKFDCSLVNERWRDGWKDGSCD
ncbi:FAD-linked sulfhydryl oxidase ALR-like isoform X2 [Mya arenaria]|uniref:FAD-linked sulfhydryl oxidase ALR-like isoform X2 n=1 Tax=Mya arenaria TaxID=6604 RepID=UPI0022E48371|nr:FAD-linked sulfhydryl oxidase ALR-like isoform X2 [Mya arenaria]